MASTPSWLVTALPRRLRGPLGFRFARFAGAAVAALTATEIALTIANGVFHLTATPAALMSWFAGAVVSYAMSRWAWNRTGRPDVLRETVPFWAISAVVIVLLTLANKLGYHSAAWLHLTGAKHVLWVDFVWLLANFGTFLLRFVILHYVLFADRPPAVATRLAAPYRRTPRRLTPRPPDARRFQCSPTMSNTHFTTQERGRLRNRPAGAGAPRGRPRGHRGAREGKS